MRRWILRLKNDEQQSTDITGRQHGYSILGCWEGRFTTAKEALDLYLQSCSVPVISHRQRRVFLRLTNEMLLCRSTLKLSYYIISVSPETISRTGHRIRSLDEASSFT